jgi:hypothetical protein
MLRSVDMGIHERSSWRRRRRMTVDQPDRRAMECCGWRTMLDYTENHLRATDGTLLAVVPRWTAEAERADPTLSTRTRVATATATTREEVWAQLRQATAIADLRPYDCADDF